MAKEFIDYRPEISSETPNELNDDGNKLNNPEIPPEIPNELNDGANESNSNEKLLLKELKKETGIGEEEINKIKKSRQLLKAFKILLLAFGLSLGVAQGVAQEADPIERRDEQKDKFFEAKKNFIDLMMRLQNKGLLEYRSREKGFEEAVIGQIDKYQIENAFLYYNPGQEKGKVGGAENEISSIEYRDENDTIYEIMNSKGKFMAFAFNYKKPVDGFEKKDKNFMVQFGIIIDRNKGEDGIYYREMTAEEVNEILDDVEQKAGLRETEK